MPAALVYLWSVSRLWRYNHRVPATAYLDSPILCPSVLMLPFFYFLI